MAKFFFIFFAVFLVLAAFVGADPYGGRKEHRDQGHHGDAHDSASGHGKGHVSGHAGADHDGHGSVAFDAGAGRQHGDGHGAHHY